MEVLIRGLEYTPLDGWSNTYEGGRLIYGEIDGVLFLVAVYEVVSPVRFVPISRKV